MPILAATVPPQKRRVPVWPLLLALVVLPLVGVFAWSCYQPVVLKHQGGVVVFGRISADSTGHYWQHAPGYAWRSGPGFGQANWKLPGGRKAGWYVVACMWW